MRNLKSLLFLRLMGLSVRFSYAQTIPIINVNQLDSRLENGADTTFVVNFWATWCGPCVKELPYFEALGAKNSNEKFKVLLVTLDFVENLESNVIPFISNKEIKVRFCYWMRAIPTNGFRV
ncbi:MAG: TlpA family protein disulfide reductase [Flavobacteriales bacterium]|jgi:thiol-disulfide isomerase/thioredoxin|nr:TlpA family protein disulfide reductase [Flavobacteriales bacterium]